MFGRAMCGTLLLAGLLVACAPEDDEPQVFTSVPPRVQFTSSLLTIRGHVDWVVEAFDGVAVDHLQLFASDSALGRSVSMDVPLEMRGEWRNGVLAVSYAHASFRDAPSFAGAQVFVDERDRRFLVTGVDLEINKNGAIKGTAFLQPDLFEMPPDFPPEEMVPFEFEGTLRSQSCRTSASAAQCAERLIH